FKISFDFFNPLLISLSNSKYILLPIPQYVKHKHFNSNQLIMLKTHYQQKSSYKKIAAAFAAAISINLKL
ncbi:hypothetical protein, partial [Ruminococcus sp.]|uniref:hypothetical protein n=1 Tax=Ruminococcus sp. TaxID=41978 RepID=UPI0025DC012A